MAYTVRFDPQGKALDVEEGTLISDAAKTAGVNIELPCGGKGRCGRCMVTISVEGKGSERKLACQTPVDADMVVTVQQKEGSVIASDDHRKVKVDRLSPIVRKDGYNYGLAIDIGTTTIAVSIVDMTAGIDLYSATGENRQRRRGEDVLTRIQYAEEGGTDELRSLVLESVNDLIDVCLDRRCSPDSVNAVYVSGNTTMIHLFLGIDPSPIRAEPYDPVVREAEITGEESGLSVNKEARVICMPSVSSYVGGDITSGITVSGMDIDEEMSMLIDVGTNGEVALGNRDMMVVCSSSAGPAFEGGTISSGMIARTGAIDSIRIVNGKMEYTVIGSKEPKGICGSGLIDLVAELFRNGWVDKRGNFTDKAGAKKDGDDVVLLITDDVRITQDDINTIIMTKAAIFSSLMSMLKNIGADMMDMKKIYIAGGFGNFIDLESAITIGLFPDVPRDRFVYLGNASLGGAKYALLSKQFRSRISKLFKRMTYLDLSSNAIFFDEYTGAQFIPHTDPSLFPSVKGLIRNE